MINPEHRVTIEYCVPCGYRERAVAEAGEILRHWAPILVGLELKTGTKGIFDVTVDDELVFSKGESKRFPEPGELVRRLEPKLGQSLDAYL